MATIKKSARAALARGRDTAVTVGKIAKAATIKAAKAGAHAAMVAGTAEIQDGIREAREAPKRRKRVKLAAAVGGVAALTVAGIAISRSRKKTKLKK